MKRCNVYITVLFLSFGTVAFGQSKEDVKGVEAACLDYLEGFYEGDTTKLIRSIRPALTKFGYFKQKDAEEYGEAGYMSFEEAKAYAKGVYEKKRFPGDDAPKKVKVLDVMNQIAAAKVTAWWGSDYLLLSKSGDKWMIDQVLWEGPLVTKNN